MYGYSPDIYSFSQDITQILPIAEGEWNPDKPHRILLKSVSFHDVNFVTNDGTGVVITATSCTTTDDLGWHHDFILHTVI